MPLAGRISNGLDKGSYFATIKKDMINIMTTMDKNVRSG